MSVELIEARGSDSRLIETLLDDYLQELSGYREVSVGATDAATYPYLDAYWSEAGRHAFIIQWRGTTVGFVFVRDPDSTGSSVHELSEFYIEPESRRLGIGRRAVAAIWRRFPGEWEFQVHARNTVALQFWTSCAKAEANGVLQVRDVQARDGGRVQFNLRVGRVT